jgi:hypothetical protein
MSGTFYVVSMGETAKYSMMARKAPIIITQTRMLIAPMLSKPDLGEVTNS